MELVHSFFLPKEITYEFQPPMPEVFDSWILPKPGIRYTQILKDEFKVEYVIDAFGRRSTPSLARPKFAAFFGCSFVYGVGVTSTLPMEFSKVSSFQTYNYGFGGYGPPGILRRLETHPLAQEIPQKEGVGIYVFIDDHVRRTVGSMRYWGTWGSYLPYYSDSLEFLGSFRQLHPWKSFFFSLLARSSTLKYYGVDFPQANSQEDLQKTAFYIQKIREKFLEAFPGQPFVVLFFPEASGIYGKRLQPLLEAVGIRVLDYSQMMLEKDSFFSDRHPKLTVHRVVAKQLQQDLRKAAP